MNKNHISKCAVGLLAATMLMLASCGGPAAEVSGKNPSSALQSSEVSAAESGYTTTSDASSQEGSSVISSNTSSALSSDGSSATSSKTSSATSSSNKKVNFVIPFSRGINLSGLESSNTWNSAYLKNSSIYEDIKKEGFDHVRLPVDLRLYYDSSAKKLKSNISDLDKILTDIDNAGLYCCLDFHGWATINTSDAAQKDMFLTIWQLIAERYKDRSDKLCFELLNEPHTTEGGNLDAEHLNVLQRQVIALIRKTNPTRIIIAAAAGWNGTWTLNDMVLPTNDGHIAIACHCYAPMAFTHQGATWADMSSDQVRFNVNDKTASGVGDIEGAFYDIRMWYERTGIPVILNEFGVNHVSSKVDKGDVTKWLNYVTERCRKYNVPWTYWEYNMGFGAYRNGKWVDYVVKGLGLE